MVEGLQTTSHKTNQETHASQLILDKLCSLPVLEKRMVGCGWVWL